MEQNQVNRLQMVQFECHKVGNPLVSFNLGLIVKAPFSLEESQARGTRTYGDSKRVRPSGESRRTIFTQRWRYLYETLYFLTITT